jgi:hypothetical protein
MSAGNSLKSMPMITVDTSTLNNTSYIDITSGVGLLYPISLLHIYNATTADILISYDGATADDVAAAKVSSYVNFQLSATPNNFLSLLPKGTRIYLKLTAASSTGDLYIAGYYQK